MIQYLNYVRKAINESPYLAGITMILLNIGSKYVEFGFTKTQEQALRNGLARELILFSMVFMATKDILYSILMTAAFIILTDHLFNHESRFCIMPGHLNRIALEVDRNGDNIISKEEEEKAIELLRKVKEQQKYKRQAEFTSYLSESNYSQL
tara:strand:- start:724 stop:1179 length:456 start_codon:yes stop_codon:yes gene_type:complete